MPTNNDHSVLYRKQNAHNDPIYSCLWTKTNTTGDSRAPSKDFIVTSGLDGVIKIWTYEGNKLELFQSLEGHTMAVVSIAVSPDGHTLASTSLDCTLIIWDLLTGQIVHDIPTKATDTWHVVFSPDGAQVASGSHTGKVVIYDVAKATEERILDTRGKFAMSLDWSPDGRYIATGSVEGSVCIFNVAQGKLVHTVEAHSKPVRSVAFSPNSKLLVTASHDGLVKVYDVESANLKASLEHKDWALHATVSGDGSRVATTCVDGSVRITSKDNLEVLHTFSEHNSAAWMSQFNAEATKLVSVSKDKSIIVYECPIPRKTNVKSNTNILIK